jgi:ABC-type transport system involved in cytochrome c biogenesis ATPase subunit
MQDINYKALSIDRARLAGIPELMTEEEAWAKFEEAMRDVQSFDEAIAWLNKHPEIKEGLTVYEMMRQFNRDISEANKYYRN